MNELTILAVCALLARAADLSRQALEANAAGDNEGSATQLKPKKRLAKLSGGRNQH
jgi:hypothetical protein